MFLKHYAGCSDQKLIEQLNGNLDYQFFCDILLGYKRITNYKIVSQIRGELACQLNINDLEKHLYNHWAGFISHPEQATTDATCYESELRYPTNQKLLWEAVSWLYNQLRRTCRALLLLLEKFIAFESQLQKGHNLDFAPNYYKRMATIKTVCKQQALHFKTGKKIENRIVSISKPYLRPIVRGKEVKPVEFGAKVNKLQIDGINFIEHISFDAFNEGTRLQSTIYRTQSLTHKKLRVLGADAIYATNKNRNYVTKHNIKTDFKRKGPKPKGYKEEKTLKALITKERATRLEGSFGKEKEHYHLKKVKAKTKANEILWIFFGIHTANALEIGRRMQKAEQKQAA